MRERLVNGYSIFSKLQDCTCTIRWFSLMAYPGHKSDKTNRNISCLFFYHSQLVLTLANVRRKSFVENYPALKKKWTAKKNLDKQASQSENALLPNLKNTLARCLKDLEANIYIKKKKLMTLWSEHVLHFLYPMNMICHQYISYIYIL